MKTSVKVLLLSIVTISFLLALNSCKQKVELDVVFFEDNNGECSVISSKDEIVVIDCGNGEENDIIEYLNEKNVRSIDALIISDFTNEHFKGTSSIMESFSIEKIYVPGYYYDGEDYDAFMNACDVQSVEPYVVDGSISFGIGDVSVRIYAASDSFGVEKGDHSLITRIVCDERSFLFASDAEEKRLEEFMMYDTNSYDLIKIPSHGKNLDNTKTLIDISSPEYAIIVPLDGVDSNEIRQYLEGNGCKVYSTGEGMITVNSDGKKIEINNGAAN